MFQTIPFTRDDGHRTTAQELAERAARDAQERKPIAEHQVVSAHVSNGATVTFVDSANREYSYGPTAESKANVKHVWKPRYPF